jgi:acid stress-induced BolA-like protein IbaG/YrbA
MDIQAIQSRILQAMPGADVRVESDDNVHYVAHVVNADFAGLSRIQRHRRVHEAIGEALGREIHALSLDLKTPDEAGLTASGD